MFDLERLTRPSEDSITLMTRRKTVIPNVRLPEAIPSNKRAAYQLFRKNHGQSWQDRKESGSYNCFGMAFANRRTSIYDEVAVRTIRDDDGYVSLKIEEVVSGDLILYKTPKDGYIHVGVVVENKVRKGIRGILVLSKWGDYFGEDFHDVYHHPFRDYDGLEIECWTDRN